MLATYTSKFHEINVGHFSLVAAVIRQCFVPILKKNKYKARNIKRTRIAFAKNSKMLKMFCDCTDGLEYDQVKNEIIKFNL